MKPVNVNEVIERERESKTLYGVFHGQRLAHVANGKLAIFKDAADAHLFAAKVGGKVRNVELL